MVPIYNIGLGRSFQARHNLEGIIEKTEKKSCEDKPNKMKKQKLFCKWKK